MSLNALPGKAACVFLLGAIATGCTKPPLEPVVTAEIKPISSTGAKWGACEAPSTGVPFVTRVLTTAQPERKISLPRSGAWRVASGAAAWASGDEVYVTGGGKLLRSSDRGETFDEGTSPITANVIYGTGANDVYLAGGRSLAHSTDGGATWTVGEPFDDNAHVAAIAGREAEMFAVGGRIGGSSVLFAHSNDHGKTWRNERTGIDDGWLEAVAVRGANDVFVAGRSIAGHRALLLRSKDCGATWTRLETPKADRIDGLCVFEGRLVVSTSTAVWTSDDDGATWTASIEPGGELLALACQGEEIAAGGRNGTFVRSHDSGKNWAPEAIAVTTTIGIFFAPSGEAYVVGEM